jgi:hypothetical protein
MVDMRCDRLEEKRMHGADKRNDQRRDVMNTSSDSRMGNERSRLGTKGGASSRAARASGPGDRVRARTAREGPML